MEFLKEVLGEGYEAFAQMMKQYNEKSPDKAVKLANLSEGGYVSKEKYAALEAEAGGYKEQLTGLREDLQKLQEEGGGKAELNNKLSALQAKYDADTKALAEKLDAARLDSALDLSLIKAGARSTKALRGLLELDKIKLDGDELLGLSEQLEQVKKENSYLFQDAAPEKTGMRQGGPASGGATDFMKLVSENQAKRE
nr:MAG TPA: minor structural protein [Caudoviricetes sp.]